MVVYLSGVVPGRNCLLGRWQFPNLPRIAGLFSFSFVKSSAAFTFPTQDAEGFKKRPLCRGESQFIHAPSFRLSFIGYQASRLPGYELRRTRSGCNTLSLNRYVRNLTGIASSFQAGGDWHALLAVYPLSKNH